MVERIPQTFIDDLVDRSDITEIIGKRVEIKKAGKEYKACCPFHNEKTPSFTISPEKGFYHCFGCGAHGTSLGFLMDYEKLTFVEAIEELAKMLGMEVPKSNEDIKLTQKQTSLKSLLNEVSGYFQSNLKSSKKVIEYLKDRGIDGKTAKYFGIGFSNNSWDDLTKNFGTTEKNIDQLFEAGLIIKKDKGGYYDRFRNRVMFPIRDNRGDVVGFGGRVIDEEDDPKYLNSPETTLFKKGYLLYGLFEGKQEISNTKEVILVEGYTDVIGLAQYGMKNALATLGTATTENHIKLIFQKANELTFCFDADNAGKKAVVRALEICLPLIKQNKSVRFLMLEKGSDPDTAVREHGSEPFKKLLKESFTLDDMIIEICNSSFEIDSLTGKANAAEKAIHLVRQIREGIYKDLVVEKIAKHYGVPTKSFLPRSTEIQKPRKEVKRESIKRPTLVHQAIRVLLHQPSLGTKLSPNDHLEFINLKGVDILKEIIGLVHDNESIKVATIVQHFENDQLRRFLAELAVEEIIVNASELEKEFDDIVLSLKKANTKKELNSLLEKAKNKDLSESDEKRLKELTNNPKN
ncbi:MAG: DNA primase [Gammaproteobacteria bacterium]|nr:DNA primase [Gammaproteobacteria bacterium]